MSNQFIVIVLVFFSFINVILVSSDTTSDLHGYILVLQWPNTTCFMKNTKFSKNVMYPRSFGIHGLRPINSIFTKPKETSKFHYPKSGLQCPRAIPQDLPIYWPNILKGDNTVFWAHEWESHGRYSGLEICAYFIKTLSLYKKLNTLKLVEALATSSKHVVLGSSYDLPILSAAFKETLGDGKNDITIKCAKIGISYYLWEVHVYVNTTFSLVNSPKLSEGCLKGEDIIFPSPL
ncbi:putative ribonuclease T(2) [Lupinus albus]|uniref:Putative ribonuclease T(2) n=1 Tax=Lupinus albus TaxID=3870 RepID=A0A6A4NLF9_LUPAL|nr:putative ribonuclease T(2) [Lupinus albus]